MFWLPSQCRFYYPAVYRMAMMGKRGQMGKMLFVIPSLHRLVAIQKLVGIICMLVITVKANLQDTAVSQRCPNLEGELLVRKMIHFENFYLTAHRGELQGRDDKTK